MIVVVVGPTGIGKTKLSIELAKKYNAEIINADSVQIYKEVNIASAKIKPKEMENIPHYMLSIKSLKEKSTIYDFQKEGRAILDKLIKENKNIIIVGGSGLYLKALLYNYELEEEIENEYDYSSYTNEELKKIADEININNCIHVNNRKRLIRFITYYKKTGKIITEKTNKNEKKYDFKLIGLTTDRETLKNQVNKRVDEMVKEGLIEEVKNLYEKKCPKLDLIIGCKELIPYFEHQISKNEAIENIKKDTKKYLKRQYTWYNNQMKDIKWFTVDINNFNSTIKEVIQYLK